MGDRLARWEVAVLTYVEPLTQVTSAEILLDVFPRLAHAAWSMDVYKAIGRLLRAHGWMRAPWRDSQGRLFKGYQRRLPGPLQDRRYKENRGVTPVPPPGG